MLNQLGLTRLLPNHIRLPQTNELGQCTSTGRYRPSSHQKKCCLPHGTHTTNDRHQLHHHRPAASRLKSRKSFMRTDTPIDSSASSSRLRLWKDTDTRASLRQNRTLGGPVFAGWMWRGLAMVASSKTTAHRGGPCENGDGRWGYLDDAHSVDCDCGEPQTVTHLLSCRLLDEACTTDDLATVRAKACADKWENIVYRRVYIHTTSNCK